MAILADNSLLKGTKGKFGDMVFKTRNGKTYITHAPQRTTGEYTSNQLKQQDKFMRCVNYAKEAIKDAATKSMYAAAAKKGSSAYNVAVADAFNAPVVHRINVDSYRGRKRDSIWIEATDDFRVDNVLVGIYSSKGELIEQGEAVSEDGRHWKYVATKRTKYATDCTIIATAIDLPGNEGSLEVKKEGSIWRRFSL